MFYWQFAKIYIQDPHIPLTSYDLLSTSHGPAMLLIEVTVTLFTASLEVNFKQKGCISHML